MCGDLFNTVDVHEIIGQFFKSNVFQRNTKKVEVISDNFKN